MNHHSTLTSTTFVGASGRTYTYEAFPIGTPFRPVGANYVFARSALLGVMPVYVGETSDLSKRFDDHHKMPCILGSGATHVFVRQNASLASRLTEESDLIAAYKPCCNG